MKIKNILIAASAVVAAMTMSACSSAATGPDVVALHYKAGPLSATEFDECIPQGSRDWNGPADLYYYYPASLRFWDATGGDNADAAQIQSVSDDNAEMLTPVIVNFTLRTDDCNLLRDFHEKIGNRQQAYLTDENASTSDGWRAMLNRVMGKPLETIVDRVAQQYNWRDMWNKPEIRKEMEDKILAELPALVARQTDGVQYFDSWAVTVNQPSPKDEKLIELVRNEQNNVAEANAVKAKAEADKASAEAQAALAEAQIATAKAEAAKIAERIRVLGVEGYLRELAIEKGVNPFPTTVGTPVTSNR